MTNDHDASIAVHSSEDVRQLLPDTGTGGVRLSDRTLRHLRLVPSLLDFAAYAWRCDPAGMRGRRNWAGSIMVLTDQPEYDPSPWLDDQDVADGDVESALVEILAASCETMTPRPSSYPHYNPDRPEPMEYDVALSYRSRILGVVRHSPRGPIATRLDGAPATSEQDDVAAPIPVASAPCDAYLRQMRWVSTPQTRATASRLIRQEGNRHAPWMRSVTALIGVPDPYRDHRLPAQEFAKDGLSGALDAVITMACEAMLPVTPDRSCLDPDHPEPLAHDIAVACCGRVLAVVQNSPAGQVVTVFNDSTPMVKNGLSAEEVAPT
jgi:hypothetical protein